LKDVLLLPEDEASATACRVEHVIDDNLITRLDALNKVFAEEAISEEIRVRLAQKLVEVQ
jgi:Mn-dependent DtxR family transcriptional regulator